QKLIPELRLVWVALNKHRQLATIIFDFCACQRVTSQCECLRLKPTPIPFEVRHLFRRRKWRFAAVRARLWATDRCNYVGPISAELRKVICDLGELQNHGSLDGRSKTLRPDASERFLVVIDGIRQTLKPIGCNAT